MERRRYMGATKDDYIQDGLVFQLDGIDYGGVAGHWIELKNGFDWYEHEGTDLHHEDGYMLFPGGKWMLCNDTIPAYPDSTHCIEGCFRYDVSNWNSIINLGTDNVALWMQVQTAFGGARGSNKPRIRYDNVAVPNTLSSPFNVTTNIFGNTFNVNGEIVPTYDTYNRGGNGRAIIGALESNAASSYNMQGRIYAIRIYNRQLTAEEIAHNQHVDNVRFNLGLDL